MKNLAMVSVLLIFGLLCLGCGDTKPAPEPVEPVVEEVAPEPAALPEIDPKDDIGIGPISSMELVEIDPALSETGEALFEEKCSPCHKFNKRYTGPALGGVTERRRPEWIMNMMLNPDEMVKANSAAKELLVEYLAPMANQSLTEEEARAILEFFRTIDSAPAEEEENEA